MRPEVHQALLNHVLGAVDMGKETPFDIAPYVNLLPASSAEYSALQAILTTVAPQNSASGAQAFVQQAPLQFDRDVIMPTPDPGQIDTQAFTSDWAQLTDPTEQFETASELLRKHFWCLPGYQGEVGVSLYEEFKALAALVYASGFKELPAEEFLLVSGDFPGVQNVLYSVSTQGAAKGLRGRSFFMQLVGDALVRRLLDELQLAWQNIIYSAGGNFILLAPYGAESRVQTIIDEVTESLLNLFAGDIGLSVAYEPILKDEFADERFSQRWQSLKQSLTRAKQTPFINIVSQENGWRQLFEPGDIMGLWEMDEVDSAQNAYGQFQQLADQLAENRAAISYSQRQPINAQAWQQTLAQICRHWYTLHNWDDVPQADASQKVYLLNETDFMSNGATGFRFVATLTPQMTQEDFSRLRERYPEADARELGKVGGARTFELLSDDAEGIKRLGILRMDIDSLGDIFRDYLHPLTMTRYSAASAAISLFFDGWLNNICGRFETYEDYRHLYIIYAGGDDLFIVGPWSFLPWVAEEIRNELRNYVNHNPYITISAGIAVVGERYPLSRAAEYARASLDDKAKAYVHPTTGYRKNAICFLGQVAHWDDEWPLVAEQRQDIVDLVADGMPRALIQTLRQIYSEYLTDWRRTAVPSGVQNGQGNVGREMVFGRWQWMQAYRLTRLARKYANDVPDAVDRIRYLQQSLLTPQNVHLTGMAARWADYSLRTEEEEE